MAAKRRHSTRTCDVTAMTLQRRRLPSIDVPILLVGIDTLKEGIKS